MRDQDRNTSATSQAPMWPSHAPQLLSDRPLTSAHNDKLGFAAYADALAGIIGDSKTDTPLTIAISAEWGAGKTSLARMVEDKLLEEGVFPNRQNMTCWFNAWMHDDAPNLGSAFAAMVAKDINRYRPIWRRLVSPLPSSFYSPQERWRHRILMGLMSFFIVVLAALLPNIRALLREEFTSSPMTIQINSALSARWASVAILAIAIFSASRLLFGIAQATARFVDNPQAEAARGSMQSVHDQLASLINQASIRKASPFHLKSFRKSRLVIFVDDLERCRPPRALDVCEVANQLLSVEGVVTVLIADMQAIMASVAMKYLPNESDSYRNETGNSLSPLKYGRAYLEKMIQINFSVPVSRPESLKEMLAAMEGEGSDQPGNSEQRIEDRKGVSLANATPEFVTEVRRQKDISENWTGVLGAAFIFGWIPFLILAGLINFKMWWWIAIVGDLLLTAVALMISLRSDAKLERMTGRAAKEVDEYIREISEKTNSVEDLREAVQNSSVAQNASTEFVDQRIQRFLVDESRLRRRAELTLNRHIPTLPRGAKRAINQLRVALAVAERRGMFDNNSPLQPEHLGKWIALVERWPEVAAKLKSEPREIGDLESLSIADMKRKISDMSPDADNIEGLCSMLQSDPRLQPVLDHLVGFEPWVPDTTDSTDEVRQQGDELGRVTR